MNDLREVLPSLFGAVPEAPRFPPNSRYVATPTTPFVDPRGRTILYLRRRFPPHPEDLAVIREVEVEEGQRLDTLAYLYLGDPELSWRICDANRTLNPDEVEARAGADDPRVRRIAIALPEGFPGGPAGQGGVIG
jgi:hypothetical protein